ncbi:MAG: GDYXXLXY domain-containing protein [Flavobacteriales bacterium]
MLFIGIALAQLAVLAWMVVRHDRVLSEGEAFHFRTAPIDPRDPFRGEYVRLGFEAENGAWPLARIGGAASGRPRAYALLAADSLGFARIAALQAERPSQGAYVAVEVVDRSADSVSRIRLPFDRFYLEEGDGAKTERLLTPSWDGTEHAAALPAHAVVRVLRGKAVVEDLMVGGRSIRDWLEATPEQAEAWRRALTPLPAPAEDAPGGQPPPVGPS